MAQPNIPAAWSPTFMFSIFAIIGLIIVAALALILIIAATKPDTFRVERSIMINASPATVAALINDFHNWPNWSPWAKLDPNMKVTYTGIPGGVGSGYAWEGNAKVGQGSMKLTSAEANKTTIQLNFLKPFEGHNTAEFLYTPQGPATRIDWVMYGSSTFFPGKIMSVFITMDKMMGPTFEQGLHNLKTEAER
jgi:hypothetical protein